MSEQIDKWEWWCSCCNEVLIPERVTYAERCGGCGAAVFIVPVSGPSYEELQTVCAEKDKEIARINKLREERSQHYADALSEYHERIAVLEAELRKALEALK